MWRSEQLVEYDITTFISNIFWTASHDFLQDIHDLFSTNVCLTVDFSGNLHIFLNIFIKKMKKTLFLTNESASMNSFSKML